MRPKAVSRVSVHVVLRDKMSISPDCSAVSRSFADSGVNLTCPASPNTAAATARHTSTSMPAQLPLSSGLENPGSPLCTPHLRCPLAFTASRVSPAEADCPSARQPSRKVEQSVGESFKIILQNVVGPEFSTSDGRVRWARNPCDGNGRVLWAQSLANGNHGPQAASWGLACLGQAMIAVGRSVLLLTCSCRRDAFRANLYRG